jgi:hypothetical protein
MAVDVVAAAIRRLIAPKFRLPVRLYGPSTIPRSPSSTTRRG